MFKSSDLQCLKVAKKGSKLLLMQLLKGQEVAGCSKPQKKSKEERRTHRR